MENYNFTENYLLLPDGTVKSIDLKSSLLGLEFPSDRYVFNKEDESLARLYAASILAYRCITVKALAISSIPLRFIDEFDRELPKRHKVRKAFGKRQKKLWRAIVRDWNIYGKFYLEPYRTNRGEVFFKRINPTTMKKYKTYEGIKYFEQNIHGKVQAQWFPEELVYIHDYNAEDDLEGFSPTQQVIKAVGIELSLQDFVKSYFENGATPSGILSTEQAIRPVESERYAAEWRKEHGGANKTNRIAVLGAGLKYQQLTPTVKDLVIDTLSETTALKICQAYGVPLSVALALVPKGSSGNLQEDRELLYRETLIPELEGIADDLSDYAVPFITLEDCYIEPDLFKIDVLQNTRQIITERSTSLFKFGVGTLNESRRMENMPLINGGDSLFLGGRLIPVDKLQSIDGVNQILAGQPLNQAFETNPTEPINPNSYRQAERLRNEEPKFNTQSTKGTLKKETPLTITGEQFRKDLKQWKTKALNKGSNVSFAPNYIPTNYANFIRFDIQNLTDEKVREYFDTKIGLFDTVDVENLSLFEDYWDSVPEFILEINDIITEHYNIQKDLIIKSLKETGVNNLYQVIHKHDKELFDKLLPIVQKLVIIGYTKAYSNNPTSEKGLGDLLRNVGKKAVDALNTTISQITNTTYETVSTKYNEWTSVGGNVDNFITTLEVGTLINVPEGFVKGRLLWILSNARNKVISETLSSEVYSEAFLEAAQEQNKRVQWITAQDERVCAICGERHGKTSPVVNRIIQPIDGLLIPAHPRCRCFWRMI